MPITDSRYVPDAHTQRDGRRYVTEYRTITGGEELPLRCYGPMADGTDFQAILEARDAQINEQLAAQEAEALWG